MIRKLSLLIPLLLILAYCARVPSEKLSQFNGRIVEYEVQNDSLKIRLSNPLHCPVWLSASSTAEDIQEKITASFPLILPAKKDTLLVYRSGRSKEETPINFSARLGDPEAPVIKSDMTLPFPEDYEYKVIQGYNGTFSHDSEYSKYALDFNLSIGDTIAAAADGFVVGVIEGYTEGGGNKKWRDYANFITLFHPEMNLYTQYVHLMHEGSLVEVGDTVLAGQSIGLSGATGYAGSPHLHFNVLQATDSGMVSTPISFREGYRGMDLKKGDRVRK